VHLSPATIDGTIEVLDAAASLDSRAQHVMLHI
jgi:hypothetical protein